METPEPEEGRLWVGLRAAGGPQEGHADLIIYPGPSGRMQPSPGTVYETIKSHSTSWSTKAAERHSPWRLTLPRLPVPYKARRIYFTSSERETKFLGGLSTPEILTMLDSVNTYTPRASPGTPSFSLPFLPLP